MLEAIKEILIQYTEVEKSLITEDSNLQNDLELNSFDVMNIVVDFEDTFDIDIPDEDVSGLVTVKDIEEYLAEKECRSKTKLGLPETDFWEKMGVDCRYPKNMCIHRSFIV